MGLAKGRKVFEGTPDEVNEEVIHTVYGDVDIEGLPGDRMVPTIVQADVAGGAAGTSSTGVA